MAFLDERHVKDYIGLGIEGLRERLNLICVSDFRGKVAPMAKHLGLPRLKLSRMMSGETMKITQKVIGIFVKAGYCRDYIEHGIYPIRESQKSTWNNFRAAFMEKRTDLNNEIAWVPNVGLAKTDHDTWVQLQYTRHVAIPAEKLTASAINNITNLVAINVVRESSFDHHMLSAGDNVIVEHHSAQRNISGNGFYIFRVGTRFLLRELNVTETGFRYALYPQDSDHTIEVVSEDDVEVIGRVLFVQRSLKPTIEAQMATRRSLVSF